LEAYLFVLFVGLVAGILSGVIGTGSSIMLLPVLVFTFGPKQAVPIMAVAAIMANISRVIAWWREINWKAFAAYSVTGVPAAAMGASTLWVLPVHMVDIGLGLMKGAFLSTEAVSSLALYMSKVVTFQELGALPIEVIVQGVIIGTSLMLGMFVAKRVVQRMSIASFRYVLDVLLLCSGLSMLWTGFAL